MANLNDFANALNSNQKLTLDEKSFIVDFVGDLDEMGEKIGKIDYTNLLHNLKDLNIQNADKNTKSGYSINDNTIYLDRNSTDKKWRVNLYKSLLQCSITNRNSDKTKCAEPVWGIFFRRLWHRSVYPDEFPGQPQQRIYPCA